MLDPASIDAVVFDIGGVFVVPHGPSVREWFDQEGYLVTDVAETYHRAHYHGVRALSSVTGFTREADPTFWAHYEEAYLTAIGVPAERLPAARQALNRLFKRGAATIWREVVAHNVAGFHRIALAGVPTAVVSNNDGTAEAQLVGHGICQVGPGPLPSVAIVVDSGLVGTAKPDPAIFAPALDALGTAPARTLYVGDTVHADVAGADAAGMPVVQLDPYELHADFHHHRLPDVDALADLLLGDR